MKVLKHSKYKNTGILYELLVRQVTTDLVSGGDSRALEIIKKYFAKNTELAKELNLYQSLVNESYNSETKAGILIETVTQAKRALNQSALKRQKYNLIKEISEAFVIEDLFNTRIQNYKVYASIYKIFEHDTSDNVSDIVKSRISIVEHLIRKSSKLISESSEIDEFSKQPKEIRIVAYKLLVDRFNKKYSALNVSQRQLIREYINNISNTNNLKEYVVEEANKVKKVLSTLLPNVTNDITKIKLQECIKLLNTYDNVRRVNDNMISRLLKYQELAHELYKLDGDKK